MGESGEEGCDGIMLLYAVMIESKCSKCNKCESKCRCYKCCLGILIMVNRKDLN